MRARVHAALVHGCDSGSAGFAGEFSRHLRPCERDGSGRSSVNLVRNMVDQGVLAEELGVDFFGIGEHHTDDFPMPASRPLSPSRPTEKEPK